ncbi:hypothetical protein LCGC14_1296060, partial [marine sediment metagenome]
MDNEIKRILDFSDDIISVRNNIEDFIMFIEYLDKGGVEALNKWKNASEIIEDAVKSTSFIGAAANEINEFNSFIGELSASVNSLIINPLSLAVSISNLFSNINGLFGTVQ